jgi:ElaB/YqjD/DUF883 family membrane-anchored ribosome-binding protein
MKEVSMAIETNYSTQPSVTGQEDTRTIGNPGGSIQNAMDTSRNRLSSAYETVQHRSNELLHNAEGFIQNRPMQSVIYAASIGAVIGFVAGMLLGGERSNDVSWYRKFW